MKVEVETMQHMAEAIVALCRELKTASDDAETYRTLYRSVCIYPRVPDAGELPRMDDLTKQPSDPF